MAFRRLISVVLNQDPSPNDQFHIAGIPPVEVSLNWTVSGAIPDMVSVVNADSGACRGSFTVIVVSGEVELPAALDTVS